MENNNSLEIFKNQEFGEVRSLMIDNKPYFVANDVAKILGYMKPRRAVELHCKREVITTILDSMGRKQNTKVIPESDVERLIIKSTLPKSIEIAKRLGIKAKYVNKEAHNISIIMNSIKGIIDYKTQHIVGKYKVDLYLPELRIAIECDEFNHKDRDEKYEKKRERYIRDKLKCKFIRFNPDDIDFNVGNVINKILNIYLKKGV